MYFIGKNTLYLQTILIALAVKASLEVSVMSYSTAETNPRRAEERVSVSKRQRHWEGKRVAIFDKAFTYDALFCTS